MKIAATVLTAMLACLFCQETSLESSTQSTEKFKKERTRIVATETVPLADAVNAFTSITLKNEIGANQSSLTADELVSFIRRWVHDTRAAKGKYKQSSISEESIKRFERIADRRELSPDDEISFLTTYYQGGYAHKTWWITLSTGDCGIRIRDRSISSRKLTEKELERMPLAKPLEREE